MARDSTPSAASRPEPGSASRSESRSERAKAARRRRHRRTVLIGTAVVAVVALVGGVVLAMSGGGDRKAAPISTRRATTTTAAPSTTTTTTPVATTAVPRSADPVVALAQQYDGRYVGTWANTTFATTGPATLELRIDPVAGTATVDSDFEGDLFGNGLAQPRRITGTVTLGDPAAVITTPTKAFGPVTGRVDESLAVVLTASDVPEAKVKSFELIGRLRSDNTGFDATFSIVHRDGSTSVGTVTVLCDPAGARGSEVTTVCALSG